MDKRMDHAARMRAYERYAAQEQWMMRCGNDREGYRRVYRQFGSGGDEYADAIYEADLAQLQELLDEYHGLSDYDKAIRVLGEDYFA